MTIRQRWYLAIALIAHSLLAMTFWMLIFFIPAMSSRNDLVPLFELMFFSTFITPIVSLLSSIQAKDLRPVFTSLFFTAMAAMINIVGFFFLIGRSIAYGGV